MSVLPNTRLELVEFCKQHVPIFTANAVAIGVTPAAVTALDTLDKGATGQVYVAGKTLRRGFVPKL